MNKTKTGLGILAIGAVMLLAAGCGSGEKTAAPAPAGQHTASGHEAHSASMPKEDPLPFMKDMDKALQEVVAQVKAGKTMDAQSSAARLTGAVNKVLPHMMEEGLKEQLRQAAAEIKNSVNAGRTDLNGLEDKAKAFQSIMQETTTHLQSMSH